MTSRAVVGGPVVVVWPGGRRHQAKTGDNLHSLLIEQGYDVTGDCGRHGHCGKCRVLFSTAAGSTTAMLPTPTDAERIHIDASDLEAGWRLACEQTIKADLHVDLPSVDDTTRAKELMSGRVHVQPRPGVSKRSIKPLEPDRRDLRADATRLEDQMGGSDLEYSLRALRHLAQFTGNGHTRATLVFEPHTGRVLDVEPGDTASVLHGVAVDLGTTTIACHLMDLNSGEELAVRTATNPQVTYGANVIARLEHIQKNGSEGLRQIRDITCAAINAIIRGLCQSAGTEPEWLYKIALVGNPIMIHLLAGVDPSGLGESPYVPVFDHGFSQPAARMGLTAHPEAQVYIPPAITSYVGSDVLAGVLYSGLHRSEELSLLVDIGTNAELVIGNRHRMVACSMPAGPAFEGGEISHGMRAMPGAISRVSFENGHPQLGVIGDIRPRGICGSGLIDLVSELTRGGVIDPMGTMHPTANPKWSDWLRAGSDEQPLMRIVDGDRPIDVTQRDVRALQLAKGAVRSGVQLALEEWGAQPEDIAAVYLVGAFGNYVRSDSVLGIGMLPPVREDVITPLGNAASQGCKQILLSQSAWDEILDLSSRIECLELSRHKDFQRTFVLSMHFPKRRDLCAPAATTSQSDDKEADQRRDSRIAGRRTSRHRV